MTSSLAKLMAVRRYDMFGLVQSFPTLRNADYCSKPRGAEHFEFDAVRMNRWVRTYEGITAGSLMAGRFILQVWNPHTRWTAGRFNIVEAMQRWDYAHRDAFMAWAKDPWWP